MTPCEAMLQGVSTAELAREYGLPTDIRIPKDVTVRNVLCVDTQPAEANTGDSKVIAFAVVDRPAGRAWLALGPGAAAEPTDWPAWLVEQGFRGAVSTEYGYATDPVENAQPAQDFWEAVADRRDE